MPESFAPPRNSAFRGRQDDELVVGPLGRREAVLSEAHEAVVGMVERAKPAFADLDGLLVPRFGKEGALAAQRLNECLDLGVAKRAGEVGAKLAEEPSRLSFQAGINARAEGARNTYRNRLR